MYDVVFHSKAIRLGESNERFRKMVNDSALQCIEQKFPHHPLSRDYRVVANLKSKVFFPFFSPFS